MAFNSPFNSNKHACWKKQVKKFLQLSESGRTIFRMKTTAQEQNLGYIKMKAQMRVVNKSKKKEKEACDTTLAYAKVE